MKKVYLGEMLKQKKTLSVQYTLSLPYPELSRVLLGFFIRKSGIGQKLRL